MIENPESLQKVSKTFCLVSCWHIFFVSKLPKSIQRFERKICFCNQYLGKKSVVKSIFRQKVSSGVHGKIAYRIPSLRLPCNTAKKTFAPPSVQMLYGALKIFISCNPIWVVYAVPIHAKNWKTSALFLVWFIARLCEKLNKQLADTPSQLPDLISKSTFEICSGWLLFYPLLSLFLRPFVTNVHVVWKSSRAPTFEEEERRPG